MRAKCEMEAQNKPLRECKVVAKKIERSVLRMTGEIQDGNLNDVASSLPLQSSSAVIEIEQKLKEPEYAQAMITFIHKIKGLSENLSRVIRSIFSDDVLELYNWDGTWEKIVASGQNFARI
ncbi:PREDICTED: uncharacterized protein LOC108365254 [Rhagoletis zephyria]|uniref:uncharacterized protein LOC108365254 n=1 Tax=Rhagoletis zephyria TaxID=28612 RepID=UPI0008119D1A|nr:PREDICTED: uncharacterized protein LOC108365254 [Rhagoletis zephyria]